MDDDAGIRVVLSCLLLDAGYRTLLAGNGQAGITLAREHLPDLIIMDVEMPVLDGLAAIRVLKADPRTRHIPVIVMTAGVLPRMCPTIAQAEAYLHKPFEFDALLVAITRQLPPTTT